MYLEADSAGNTGGLQETAQTRYTKEWRRVIYLKDEKKGVRVSYM